MLTAQSSLSESPRSSPVQHVYRIDKSDMREIFSKDGSLRESMLHTFVTSFERSEGYPALERGNYIIVGVENNRLDFKTHTVDDFIFRVIGDEDISLFLSDQGGKPIQGAVVRKGAKTVRYNPATGLYEIGKAANEKVIEINNGGVLHYLEVDKDKRYEYRRGSWSYTWDRIKYMPRSLWYKTKKLFQKGGSSVYKYEGFVVFSKPKYKPGDTVRLKGYVADRKTGKFYDREAEIRLSSWHPQRIDTLLTTLKPYRPGMYEYEFGLSDSLKLKLDSHYTISIVTAGEKTNDISGSFKYEEYELKGVDFDAVPDKKSYVKGDTVRIKLTARDENGLAVYDGKAELRLTPSFRYRNSYDYYINHAFIPDEIWKEEVDMSGTPEKEIVILPDVFPQGVTLTYEMECQFLTADNEKHTSRNSFAYDMNPLSIEFSMDKGMLTIRELHDGVPHEAKALLTAYDSKRKVLRTDSVQLPYTFPVEWQVKTYKANSDKAENEYKMNYGIRPDPIFDYSFYKQDGLLVFEINNPASIPVWYEVKKGGKIIDSGYKTADFLKNYPDKGKEPYALRLRYPTPDGFETCESDIPYADKNITMEVSTASVVYPGQTTSIEVTVADKKGNPVKDADITAYATTSKFGDNRPYLKIHGELKYASFPEKYYEYLAWQLNDTGWKVKLDWERWRNELGLDTLEYYKFLHPESVYMHSEEDPDKITQVSPYVVVDGKLQKVHLLWIDDQPYYFSHAEQKYAYSFPVSPGKHNFRIRTEDRTVYLRGAALQEGKRNIISVEAGNTGILLGSQDTPEVRVEILKHRKDGKNMLTDHESVLIGNYMIGIDTKLGGLILPGLNSLDLPVYMTSGNMLYEFSNNNKDYVLAGPFPLTKSKRGDFNLSLYRDKEMVNSFPPEAGYNYIAREGYLKLTSWPTDGLRFSRHLGGPAPDPVFRGLVTQQEIKDRFEDRIMSVMESAQGLVWGWTTSKMEYCRLIVELGQGADGKQLKPALIYFPNDDPSDKKMFLYYGGVRWFDILPAGETDMTLVFRDSTTYTIRIALRSDGLNYYKIDSITPEINTALAEELFGYVMKYSNTYISQQDKAGILNKQTANRFAKTFQAVERIPGRVVGTVMDPSGETLIGVTVQLKGTNIAVATNVDGQYSIAAPSNGVLMFSYLGMEPQELSISERDLINVVLSPARNDAGTVTIIGYGSGTSLGPVVNGLTSRPTPNVSDALQGRVAGMQSWTTENGSIRIRGISSVDASSPPLYIVDGVPVSADVFNRLNPEDIKDVKVLENSTATSIYGSRAANGVVNVTTKRGSRGVVSEMQVGPDFLDEAASGIRRDFSDDAFWKPSLRTDADGRVSFEVTYPDDVTSWNANFIAVGGRRQTDFKQLRINSFKSITARLSVPNFAVEGDKFNAVGRLVNHTGDTLNVKTTQDVDGAPSVSEQSIGNSHLEYIPVTVEKRDTVSVTYSLMMDNGYVDGEERKIPVYKKGMLESYGEFAVINDDSLRVFPTDPLLGPVTVNAEASALDVFLDEIKKLEDYPYYCNEQTASKLKAMIARKRIYDSAGRKFNDGNKINNLISRLERNRNTDGLWGWWNKGETNWWMSMHILEALLDAEKEGYRVDIDKKAYISAFILQLDSNLRFTQSKNQDRNRMLDMLVMLKRLGSDADFGMWYSTIDNIADKPLYDEVKALFVKTYIGQSDSTDIARLNELSRNTIMGAVFWGEEKSENNFQAASTDTEITLMAYRALRTAGQTEALPSIRNYFFETRKKGGWRNTYESARIIETILPDMVDTGKKLEIPKMMINGSEVSRFPYTSEFAPGDDVSVSVEGNIPVFFTVYQQAWNPDPAKHSDGIIVESALKDSGADVASLRTGHSVQLEVTVNMVSAAEYVTIEVPIPAGCSYERKVTGYYRRETHREYFKDKVVIFCRNLLSGKHTFTIDLIPRYTGEYYINPAKAELMYFPVFYGSEQIKHVTVG